MNKADQALASFNSIVNQTILMPGHPDPGAMRMAEIQVRDFLLMARAEGVGAPEYQTLSILQPWAWLIVNFKGTAKIPPKRVENRSKLKNIRGETLIHTGSGFDMDGYNDIREIAYSIHGDKKFIDQFPKPDEFQRGGITGACEIHDCIENQSGYLEIWQARGQNGLLLRNVRELPFFKCPGSQGVFKVRYPHEIGGTA